jgi:hypothetical protein
MQGTTIPFVNQFAPLRWAREPRLDPRLRQDHLRRHGADFGSRLFSRPDHKDCFCSPQIVQSDAGHGMLER